MALQKLIFQGAEAKIFLDKKNNLIVKDRIKKSYRIKELDDKIRKSRTKREIKLLTKANKVINSPAPLAIHQKDKINSDFILTDKTKSTSKASSKLIIPFIKGKKLSEHLDNLKIKEQKQILRQIGEDVSKLHDDNIIHGDLTTSNMILVENQNKKASVNNKSQSDGRLTTGGGGRGCGGIKQNFKIFFIDFGLGFISHKIEDKAVDIHLLKQALEAKHFKNYKILTDEFFKGYKTSKDSTKTLNQLSKVEKRGRYKG